ncbi:MAG: membrane dipeptidase [Nitratireductor sp.]|uniref:dipeptidase n=1 Tax=Alphaproteobacteria TaxID=28211 RepID=UPI00328DB744
MDQIAARNHRERTPVVDGLNCAILTRDQFQRTLDGRVAAINLTSLRPANDLAASMSDLAKALAVAAANADLVSIVTSVAEIRQTAEQGKLGIILGTQNSTFLEHDLSLIRVMQRAGVRIMQPTYMEQNALGSGMLAPEPAGLTARGHEWVALMNEARILIDLSHVGYQTAMDAAKASKRPVICSHSNARKLCDSLRNIPDDQIRAVADTGGTVGVTLWPPMLRHATRPTLEDFFAQVDYMVNLVGIEHVAFGSDCSEQTKTEEEWQSSFGPRGIYPQVTGVLGDWFVFTQRFTEGYESLAHTGRLIDGLAARGYSEADVDKIMGGNLLRVYEDVWGR